MTRKYVTHKNMIEGDGKCVKDMVERKVNDMDLSLIVHLFFHRWSEWWEELVSANRDFSSETSDTQAANWDLSLRLKAKRLHQRDFVNQTDMNM